MLALWLRSVLRCVWFCVVSPMAGHTMTKPFTKRERHRATQNGLGHRPVNEWGSGDLPGPFAEGDVLYLADVGDNTRLRGMGPGHFVVTYATSIDEGDAWYFRVWDGHHDVGSDRLHVVFAERCQWDTSVNWMAGFELVETADPGGLARRERMLADGWSFTDRWDVCPTCGNMTPKPTTPCDVQVTP